MTTVHPGVRIEGKDDLLRSILRILDHRGIARTWASLDQPHAALHAECVALRADTSFMASLKTFLAENPLVEETVSTMLAQLAMAANSRWEDTPTVVQPLSRRGWHIGRWLPTFLIVDGPLGRFLLGATSPLNIILRTQHHNYPVLCSARDAFGHDLFRLVRNGIGHWSFVWRDVGGAQKIEMVDWSSGVVTATVTLIEAEALHFLAFSVIEALDNELFKPALQKSEKSGDVGN